MAPKFFLIKGPKSRRDFKKMVKVSYFKLSIGMNESLIFGMQDKNGFNQENIPAITVRPETFCSRRVEGARRDFHGL